MSGTENDMGSGSDAEGPGQGGEDAGTPQATGKAPNTNSTAPSPVQERIRRQAELAEQIKAAAEAAESAEPDYQSMATPAGRLHRRLKAAAEVQREADGQGKPDTKDFKSTKKEALEEEREEQRLKHQLQMDRRFESRYDGDPDLQPTGSPVQEATSLLVVGELQPDVMLAHDKAGTVSQLADKIRDRNPEQVKMLRKAAKRGGPRWSEAMDLVRSSLKADNRLEPALQSAVIYHWLSANSSTAQAAQDSMRATIMAGPHAIDQLIVMVEELGQPPEELLGTELLRGKPGMLWLDPNKCAEYSAGWVDALFVLDRSLAHTLCGGVSSVSARAGWEVVRDERGEVVRHSLQQQASETVKQHLRRIRTAYQGMQKVFRRKGALDMMPSEDQRVMSYMNSLTKVMRKRVTAALSKDKVKQENVTWSVATTYAADVEEQHSMGYEWDVSAGQQEQPDSDDQGGQGGQEYPRPKSKARAARKKKKRRATMAAAAALAQDKQDKPRGDWTAAEKSAIRRYAKEKMRPWNEVTFKEVASTTEGISGWQQRVGKELTIQQKQYWAAQDEATSRNAPEQKQQPPAQARAAASVRFRKSEAQEAAETSESDTDDEDDFVQYPVVVQDAPMSTRADRTEAAQQLKLALEAAELLVDCGSVPIVMGEPSVVSDPGRVRLPCYDMRDVRAATVVPESWNWTVEVPRNSTQVDQEYINSAYFQSASSSAWDKELADRAGKIEAAQQLKQALETADLLVHDELTGTHCDECGDQEPVCRFDKCEACCEMTACGCEVAEWRERMQERMQSLSDSDISSGSEEQPQWYQDWCNREDGRGYGGYGSGDSSDEPLPEKCMGCDLIVLGGGYCSVCREDGTEAEDRYCVAPLVEMDDDLERTTCVMCRSGFYKEYSAERICEDCLLIDREAVENPILNSDFRVPSEVIVGMNAGADAEGVTAGMQAMSLSRPEIGNAAEFAANVTQPAQILVNMQSSRPPRKKHRVIESDSGEEEFKMRIRSARMCFGEESSTSSSGCSGLDSTSGNDTSDGEQDFQHRCAVKGASSQMQVDAAELAFEAKQKGLLVTGKRDRRQAKTKLQAAVEEQPEMRHALMADVESEEDEALLETESDSDGSADRPGGRSDGEGDYICSCAGCDMPSETWVGDEPRCAQCALQEPAKEAGTRAAVSVMDAASTERRSRSMGTSAHARAASIWQSRMRRTASSACSCN